MKRAGHLSTTAKSFDIVSLLHELDGATLADLTEELGMPKSTVHRHLATLREKGFVTEDDGEYHVGFRFLELGYHARNRNEAYRLAEGPVRDLAEQTGERAQFVVEEQGEGVYLYIETGEHAVRTGLSVGHRIHLHSTAAGKVILSYLPEERVDEILDGSGLPALTDGTITDPDELRSQLSAIRDRGYAFNREENIDGLRAVAGPVTDEDGDLFGVLSVSGPSNRMKGELFETEIPDLVLGSANELELRIAYA
jgi:DNA-binding IclR family transcriptional regulator